MKREEIKVKYHDQWLTLDAYYAAQEEEIKHAIKSMIFLSLLLAAAFLSFWVWGG